MVKMKANDTLHISALGPDNIPPNGEFEVSENEATRLEKAGYAMRIGGKKAAAKPANKKAAEPANKGR